MGIVFHSDLTQGTQPWLDARRGMLTASEMGRIISMPNASSAKSRSRQ